MEARTSLRVKVAGLPQQDVGKGVVRLGQSELQDLQLERGDVVEIIGKRNTAAMAFPAYPEDEGLDILRMDGLVRSNARVGIGEAWDPAPTHAGILDTPPSNRPCRLRYRPRA